MKYVCHLAGLLAVGLLCAGCYPQRITTSPGASGVVLDAETHDPLPGAQVVMADSRRRSWPDSTAQSLAEALTNARPPVVITGTNGTFLIPREHLWVINNPMPEWHTYGTLIILKDGYQPALIPVTDLTNGDEAVGMYLLTPEKK